MLIRFCSKHVYNYTATWAGLAAALSGIITDSLAPIIGKFGNKIGYADFNHRRFMVYALTFFIGEP